MKTLCSMFLALCFVFFALCSPLHAEDVTLAWSANPEPVLAGYRVYKAETPGNYVYKKDNPTVNNMVWEGTATTCTITVPDAPYQCWFVATAFDKCGNESKPSKEVRYGEMSPPQDFGGPENVCQADVNNDGRVDRTDRFAFWKAYRAELGMRDCLK